MSALRSTLWLALCCTCGLLACTRLQPLPTAKLPLVATGDIPALRTLPAPQADKERSAPDIRTLALANGLTLYVIESHAFAHVAATFVSLDGGESEKELEHAGLASLITQVLLASADAKEAQRQTAAEAAGSGPPIRFHGQTLRHTASFSTRVQAHDLGRALRSMAELVRAPTLNDALLDVARRRASAGWASGRGSVAGVAHNHITQRLYGPTHVLGQHADMATKRLATHSLSAVKEGYARRYLPSSSVIILVGDLDVSVAKSLAAEQFADWHARRDPPVSYEAPDWTPRGKRKIFLNNRGNVACVMLGQRAPAPSDQDYVATEVIAHVLGGSFSSRLMQRLRVQAGITYSVGSNLAPRRDGSLLTIATFVERDMAESALALISYEVKRIQSDLLREDELRRVTSSLRQRELSRYETTTSSAMAMAESLELGDDPATRSVRYLKALDSLSAAEIRAVALRVLDPRAPVVIVGNLNDGELGRWARLDDEQL